MSDQEHLEGVNALITLGIVFECVTEGLFGIAVLFQLAFNEWASAPIESGEVGIPWIWP